MSYCDRRLLLPFWFASMRYRRHALVVQRAHHQGRGAEEVEGITRVQLNMFCSHSTAHSCQPTCHPARRARPDPPPRPPADSHPLLARPSFGRVWIVIVRGGLLWWSVRSCSFEGPVNCAGLGVHVFFILERGRERV